MISSVKDHINTPAQLGQSTKPRKSRRNTNLVLLASLVMFWSATMTVLYCQSVVVSMYNLNPESSSTQMTFVWMMLAGSMVGFSILVLGRKALRRTLLTLSGIVRLSLAVIMGWLLGGLLFSQSYVQDLSQAILSTTDGYLYVSNQIVLNSNSDEDIRNQWYDPSGQLWPSKKTSWCTSALANINAFVAQNTSPSSRTVSLSALLAKSSLAKVYANGCLTDEQFVLKNHELTDRVEEGSKSYRVIQRLGYFAPVLPLVGKSEEQMRQRSIFSPNAACLMLVSDPEKQSSCQSYSNDHRITVEEFTQLKAELSKMN